MRDFWANLSFGKTIPSKNREIVRKNFHFIHFLLRLNNCRTFLIEVDYRPTKSPQLKYFDL